MAQASFTRVLRQGSRRLFALLLRVLIERVAFLFSQVSRFSVRVPLSSIRTWMPSLSMRSTVGTAVVVGLLLMVLGEHHACTFLQFKRWSTGYMPSGNSPLTVASRRMGLAGSFRSAPRFSSSALELCVVKG